MALNGRLANWSQVVLAAAVVAAGFIGYGQLKQQVTDQAARITSLEQTCLRATDPPAKP